ncbi:MAG: hypothetical protein AAF090_01070 [Bacteroidota bacterium]
MTVNTKLFQTIVVAFLLVFTSKVISQQNTIEIEIMPPSIDQEATSVWRTINDIAFFEKQGYRVNLPKGEVIDALIAKSKKGIFGNEDYASIYTFLETEVFDKNDYQLAMESVKEKKQLIEEIINEIAEAKDSWDWNFKTFDRYPIVFTLYGTGGSYDPDTGRVTLFTNAKGQFMNYKSPANTIVHEISHMGMESSLVQKHKLSHSLKERLVDTFVYLQFKTQLPEYRIQNMGDTKLDDAVKNQEDIAQLDEILTKFVE